MTAVAPIRIDRAPLRREIENRLRAAIMDGHYRPGDRLIERELCDSLGVSRPSLREALRQLAAEELVRVGPQGGPVVAGVDADEAQCIYEVRAPLEALAAGRFARDASDADVAALRRAFAAFKAVARSRAQGDGAVLAAKTEFYRVLLRGCGNPVVERTLTQLHNRISLLRGTSMSRRGRIVETVAEVERIVVAIERRDPERAAQATTEHILRAAAAAREVLQEREQKENAT